MILVRSEGKAMNPFERWDDWEWEQAIHEMGRQHRPSPWRGRSTWRRRPGHRKEFLGNLNKAQVKALLAATLFLTIFFSSRGEDVISRSVYRLYQAGLNSGDAYAVLNELAKDVMVTSGMKQEAVPVDAQMASKLIPPLSGPVMAKFGAISDEGESRIHQGIDIGSALGVPVVAPHRGVVTEVGEHPQLGRVVKMSFGDGWSAVFGNLGDIDVQVGQPLEAGETIGKVGLSAPVKKPWLHFELHKDGRPVDPLPYLVPASSN